MDANGTLPTLEELGRDLLEVKLWRRVLSLVMPFVLAAGFFLFAAHGQRLAALGCCMAISFLTYGSTSHDLVHRTVRLPRWLNESLLCLTELITLRSGHAYRVTHLLHHAHFPAEDDLEGRAARLPLARALIDGLTLQPRLWWFAARQRSLYRSWILGEGAAVLALILASLAALPLTVLPAIYAGLMIGGAWIFPIVTVVIPHDAAGHDTLTSTRLFRGKILSVIALEHLYHLEHHLYPQIPHHNWPELARRLDPYFAKLGLQPIKLLF